MDAITPDYEQFPLPKYVVTRFSCSVNVGEDDSLFEVRRYGKCFYIKIDPEDLVSSPHIQQQYLGFLASERSDVNENLDDMVEDYHPEDFYEWALDPCIPLFETLAPVPEQNVKITLHDYLYPQFLYYSLHAVDGQLKLVQTDGRDSGMLAPGFELDDWAFSPLWPSFLPAEIENCLTRPEDAVCGSPHKVLVANTTIAFFKPYQHGEENMALRELENYKRIAESNLDPEVHISRLLGLVKDEENQLLGLLLTYVDCDYVTLTCAVEADTPDSTKQKWVDFGDCGAAA